LVSVLAILSHVSILVWNFFAAVARLPYRYCAEIIPVTGPICSFESEPDGAVAPTKDFNTITDALRRRSSGLHLLRDTHAS
jgi:hypothetical protein